MILCLLALDVADLLLCLWILKLGQLAYVIVENFC